jgi:pentatricopeptide repeat protein
MKTRKILAFAAAALVLSCAGFAQMGFNQEERMMIEKFKASNSKLEQGKALFAKGKYGQAEKKFRECLNMFPKNADANYFMAQILLKKNDLEKALESIEAAKTYFSELSKLYSYTHQDMLNKLREQKQQLEETNRQIEANLAVLQSGQRSEQTQAAISNAQGDIQQNKNLIVQIDSQLNKPVPMVMETPAGYFNIHGNILFKLKNYQGAAEQYLETIKREPRHELAYNNLAAVYFIAKQYDKALAVLQQAEAKGIKVNPQFKKDLEARVGKK